MKKILILGLLAVLAAGAAPADKDAEIRVYNIANLLWVPKDYPFESAITLPPTMPPTRGDAINPLAISRGGGGGGGGHQQAAAGLFGNPAAAAAAAVDQQEAMARKVLDLIVETVEPASWVQNGGVFSARYFGGMLIINQKKANHDAIAQLLGQVRAEGSRLVTVKAHWLLLAPAELDALVVKAEDQKNSAATLIDAAALAKLGDKSLHYRGQTTCFNGQTVHIASGRTRTAVTKVIAVTGDQVGLYNPEPQSVHAGAMLQLTPMLAQDDRVVVDLQSVVSEWEQAPPPIEVKEPTTRPAAASAMIDRLNLVVQQLRTTVQVPVGKPVLVGGMTFEPTTKGANSPQMYLIIEVSAGN